MKDRSTALSGWTALSQWTALSEQKVRLMGGEIGGGRGPSSVVLGLRAGLASFVLAVGILGFASGAFAETYADGDRSDAEVVSLDDTSKAERSGGLYEPWVYNTEYFFILSRNLQHERVWRGFRSVSLGLLIPFDIGMLPTAALAGLFGS